VTPLEAAIRNIEEGVSKVDETLQTLGLQISPHKTKFMVFRLNYRDLHTTKKKTKAKEGRRPRRQLVL
jgi:hypothetical protein